MIKNPIGKYLSITHRANTTLVDKIFEQKFNLSHGQVFILIKIYKNEGINQHNLCVEYNLDKSGVGRIIKKLEDKNLIVRKSDPEDKRKKLIYLTKKAKNIKPEFITTLKNIDNQMKKNLTQKEINDFLDTLKKIYNNLAEEIDNN